MTSTSVNVMVEIDCASEVSLYIFKMDKLTQEGVFHHMQVIKCSSVSLRIVVRNVL